MASSVVTIGGKASSLSSASVYAISHAFSKVQIDSAALDKLSSQSKKPSPSKTPQSSTPLTLNLTLEESRAALAVLLNKLLLSDSTVPQNLPAQIEQTLNDGNGTLNLDELDGSSVAASIGISAVLECCSSTLVRLSDAVAALSCEAARADVAIFDLPNSGDGFSNKDETDTAGDMKILLFGSKLSGKVNSEVFAEVPYLHGVFRKDTRDLHVATRVELNSGFRVEKGPRNHGKEKMLAKMASNMAEGILLFSESSLGRARLASESVPNPDVRAKLVEVFNKYCPNLEEASGKLSSFRCSDYVEVVRGAYELLAKYREVLAWEAAVALFTLDTDDSVERSSVGPTTSMVDNGEVAKGDRKKEKKKKTLGKGTSAIRQLLRERVSRSGEVSGDNVADLVQWAKELTAYFDPKDAGLDTLLARVKEIVESNEVRRLPKIPKGTHDFGKEQMAIRERAFSIITSVFKMHGAVGLDTPVFELRETLMGKYGEDSKLIYDLADQGGELCSLRYDLTVPFARYLAMNSSISALKRYQIAKVYRRDNPSRGRYREFYQCDFDIAGQYKTMEPDFEVVKVLTELLDGLNIGDYEIKLNHRKLLDGMLEICGVSSEKFRTVCSSIDKLDKQSFEQIKKELVEEKGLAIETAEMIGTLVKKRGPPLEILTDLKSSDSQFLENNGSVLALNELDILFRALEKAKCLDKVVFDLSLARGLDYYTGVIFEAVFKGSTQVGSIAAGGRYDNLVGIFGGKQVPAVGVSLGIERVFTIMEQLEKERDQAIRATETQVLVACLGEDLQLAAELVSELWAAKIKAEFGLSKPKRVMDHIKRAKDSGIPWMVIVGESELKAGIVKLKNIEAKEEVEVAREEIVAVLQRRLNIS